MNSYGVALSSFGAVCGTVGKPWLVSFIVDFFWLVFVSFLLLPVWELTGLLSFCFPTGFDFETFISEFITSTLGLESCFLAPDFASELLLPVSVN